MDPPRDLLATHPIRTGCDISIELYPSWLSGHIDNLYHHFGNGWILTWTQAWNYGPQPLLTLDITDAVQRDMEYLRGWGKSVVWLAWLYIKYIVLVLILTRLGATGAISGNLTWIAEDIFYSPGWSWWFPPSSLISPFLVLNSRFTC